MKNPIASGLGGRGKAASWAFAFTVVGGYSLYSNMSGRIKEFGSSDQEDWNQKILAAQKGGQARKGEETGASSGSKK